MLKFDVNSMTCNAGTRKSHPSTNKNLGFPPLAFAIVRPIFPLRLNAGCLYYAITCNPLVPVFTSHRNNIKFHHIQVCLV